MRPGKLINVELDIDKKSLAFLLTKYPMTWRAVALEGMRFNTLKDVIEHRNAVIAEQVWPKMEAKEIPHGASLQTADVEKILGAAVTQELKNSTAFIIETCEKDIETLMTCIADLRKVLSDMYPGRDFVRQPKKLTAAERAGG